MNKLDNDKVKLTNLIEKLPLLSRQLLSLYYVDELNTKEISLVLEIEESIVKYKLNKLIINLNKGMKKYPLNLGLI